MTFLTNIQFYLTPPILFSVFDSSLIFFREIWHDASGIENRPRFRQFLSNFQHKYLKIRPWMSSKSYIIGPNPNINVSVDFFFTFCKLFWFHGIIWLEYLAILPAPKSAKSMVTFKSFLTLKRPLSIIANWNWPWITCQRVQRIKIL